MTNFHSAVGLFSFGLLWGSLITGRIVFKTFKKELDKEKQRNNLPPIHLHEEITNTHVYMEEGVIHIKPNNNLK